MEIQPLNAEMAPQAGAVGIACQWGDQTEHFRFYVQNPHCHAYAALVDGVLAGTSAAIVRGTVGWIGHVTVLPEYRNHGFGTALTRVALEQLEAAGCSTQLLIATEQGRPIYERMGFRALTRYVLMSGPSLGAAPGHQRLRPMSPADLPQVLELDRAMTGEDRSGQIEPLSTWGYVMVDSRTGRLTGYYVRPPWGLGPVVALDPEDGRTLVNLARSIDSRHGSVVTVTAVPEENEAALEHLSGAGFTVVGYPLRMVRGGDPPAWTPRAVWGRFSGAMG